MSRKRKTDLKDEAERASIREFFDQLLAMPNPERGIACDLFVAGIHLIELGHGEAADKVCEAIILTIDANPKPKEKERP